jgi:hypothetical protein
LSWFYRINQIKSQLQMGAKYLQGFSSSIRKRTTFTCRRNTCILVQH